MEKINIGIVGLGRIADLHYPGYAGNRKARIYAVCDSDEGLCRKRKKEWKAVKQYRDFGDMLADPRVDAVEILTPQKLHEPMTVAAALARKQISLQKPMTIDLASADRMLKAVGNEKVLFRVGDNYLFYPPIVRARELIESGAIGKVSMVRIKFVGGGSGGWKVPPASWEWRMRELKEGRGMQTFDHGHHLYATAWFLGGEAERVTAWIDSADGVIDCPATIMWKYRNGGAYGMIEYAQAPEMRVPSRYYANDEWMEITGSRGIIFVCRCTGNIHIGPPLSMFNGKWKHFAGMRSDWAEGFKGATNNFINAVRGEEEPLLSGRQARTVLRFALALQRSSLLRREVYPEEMDSRFPRIYRARRRIRERMSSPESGRSLSPSKFFRNLITPQSRLGARASELTMELPERFDPSAVGDWQSSMGLRITAGESPPEEFSIDINRGVMTVMRGGLPKKPVLVLTVPASTWAAVLLKKTKIEEAFVRGDIQSLGSLEEGLKLKAALGL